MEVDAGGDPTPTVSVIIPTFNRAEFIAEALESILGQTLPPHQVIVVDDGSTDATPAVLRPYLDRIEYVAKANGGKSSAVNAGLERVRGDYVWVFDDDDAALPDALARFVAALEGTPEHGFAYSTCVHATTREDHRLGPVIGETTVPEVSERGILLPLLSPATWAGRCCSPGRPATARSEASTSASSAHRTTTSASGSPGDSRESR